MQPSITFSFQHAELAACAAPRRAAVRCGASSASRGLATIAVAMTATHGARVELRQPPVPPRVRLTPVEDQATRRCESEPGTEPIRPSRPGKAEPGGGNADPLSAGRTSQQQAPSDAPRGALRTEDTGKKEFEERQQGANGITPTTTSSTTSKSSSSRSSVAGAQREQTPKLRRAKERMKSLARLICELPDGEPVGGVMEGQEVSLKDVSLLVSRLGRSRATGRAVEVFEWLQTEEGGSRQPDAVLYSQVLSLLARRPETSQQALDLFETIPEEVGLDEFCYNAAITAAGRLADLTLAFSLLRRMEEIQLRPDVVTFTALLKACQACRDGDAALRVLELMAEAGVLPNVKTYTAAMSALSRAGRPRAAMRVFDDMEASGLDADIQTYNSLITACAAAGSWEKARDVISTMRKRGISPDVRSCNAFMSALERCGQADRALSLFRRMRESEAAGAQAAQQEQQQQSGSPPSTSSPATSSFALSAVPTLVTYNTLLLCLAKAERLPAALDVYEELKREPEIRPDPVTCTALMVACERAADGDTALEVFQEFVAAGVALNTTNYNALMAALSSSQQLERVTHLFGVMEVAPRRSGVEPDSITFSILISCLERFGEWREALDRFDEMTDLGLEPNAWIFQSVLAACEQGQQWQKAVQVCDAMAESLPESATLEALTRRLMHSLGPLAPMARAALNSGKAARRWMGDDVKQ